MPSRVTSRCLGSLWRHDGRRHSIQATACGARRLSAHRGPDHGLGALVVLAHVRSHGVLPAVGRAATIPPANPSRTREASVRAAVGETFPISGLMRSYSTTPASSG